MSGLIDTHSHLLPGVDDGCKTVDDSIQCAQMLVEAGYTHAFCTPHIWHSFGNTKTNIASGVAGLQEALTAAQVPLRLVPGAEHNFTELQRLKSTDDIITFGHTTNYVLADVWVDEFPRYFWERVQWMQAAGLTVVLAHPERMRAVQDDPMSIDVLAKAGVLLQGNLQCFGDPPNSATRRLAELLLREDRYFMLGSDTHNPQTLPVRLKGLENARALASKETIQELMVIHPRKLLPKGMELS